MVESAMSIFAGLFGGIGAVLVWELFVRPLVQGRAIAEVLSAEVSFNLEYLTAAGLVAKSNSIPMDFSLSTTVFDSVIDHVGDLPPNLVGEVVFLYRYFTELNKQPTGYAEALREYRGQQAAGRAGSPHQQAAERELAGIIAVFNQTIQEGDGANPACSAAATQSSGSLVVCAWPAPARADCPGCRWLETPDGTFDGSAQVASDRTQRPGTCWQGMTEPSRGSCRDRRYRRCANLLRLTESRASVHRV